ncbi:hypothetical protein BMS3Abin17_00096 [archaeon BMS3Abin17]|nr:hypothetical protein BMS3Abin17_00096 [archaeon BMS3Abin17]
MTIGTIMLLIVGILFSTAILGQIINTQHQITSKLTVANETVDISGSRLADGSGSINESYQFNVSNAYTGWRVLESQCTFGNFLVSNSSNDSLTVTTDYIVSTGYGNFTLKNNTDTITISNTSYVSYNYCDEGYNKDSSARGIARLWSLFAVLIILGFVALGLKNEWFK